jgi:hypothetical protein
MSKATEGLVRNDGVLRRDVSRLATPADMDSSWHKVRRLT